MKPLAAIAISLLLAPPAFADCDAPDLTFPKHAGAVHGYNVIKLMDEASGTTAGQTQQAVISFGDYSYSMVSEGASHLPRKVSIDEPAARSRLIGSLVPGEFSMEPEVPTFSVHAIEAYDLDGDLDADLIFFEVSPGANVYAGIVGMVDGQWVVVADPTCH